LFGSWTHFKAFVNGDEQALVEYGFIIGFAALVCVTTLTDIGTGVDNLLNEVVGGL
jgi:Flp pilus assembly pilin Flp